MEPNLVSKIRLYLKITRFEEYMELVDQVSKPIG